VARVVLAVLGVGPVALMVRGVRVGLGMTVVGWMEMAGLAMTVVGWMDMAGLVVWMALEGREPFQEK